LGAVLFLHKLMFENGLLDRCSKSCYWMMVLQEKVNNEEEGRTLQRKNSEKGHFAPIA